MNTIYTIGHSVHPIEEFIEILRSFGINTLADIRSKPGSRWQPQFNSAAFSKSLNVAGISYKHMPDLGGRQALKYPAYMDTAQFVKTITQLEEMAANEKVAYMCAEAKWYECHRSWISDNLKGKGWTVLHITDKSISVAHLGRQPLKPEQGTLF